MNCYFFCWNFRRRRRWRKLLIRLYRIWSSEMKEKYWYIISMNVGRRESHAQEEMMIRRKSREWIFSKQHSIKERKNETTIEIWNNQQIISVDWQGSTRKARIDRCRNGKRIQSLKWCFNRWFLLIENCLERARSKCQCLLAKRTIGKSSQLIAASLVMFVSQSNED